VAKDQRAPGADPVEVALAINIDYFAAFAARDEDRLAADLAQRPDRRVDAAGQDLLGARKEARRPRPAARNEQPPRRRTRQ
jgi:hypothetical protein